MSLSDEIRSALANSGEPLSGKELCDAMGAEDRDERDRISSCASAMVKGRKGIERDELGRYMLIPGWRKWQRNSGDSQDDTAQEKLKATTHVEIKADAITEYQYQAEILRSVAAAPGTIVLAPGIGKTSSSPATTTANKVADRILEYLRGEADYNLLQLLREAREEIQQLDCAARMALASAEELTTRLREATQ